MHPFNNCFGTVQKMFPVDYMKQVVIPETNKVIGGTLSYLRWFRIWFLMATANGTPRSEFWSSNNIDPFHGAPFCIGGWMSRNRFESIRDRLLIALYLADYLP
jgi:hypothetical protein